MYTSFYGLTGKPFSLAADPDTIYMSEAHREALAILRYGVVDRKGFILVTGEVGTGKTTLLHALVRSLDRQVHLCLINNPTLDPEDFLYYIAGQYGLNYTGNKARFLMDFARYLKECRQRDQHVLLIIDEAHVLPVQLLEEIRLLSNQAPEEYGILGIFLVGQPELNERLNHERLLPLRQRIGIRFHLKPFTGRETRQYIRFRLERCGIAGDGPFADDALEMIHQESGGIPRLINSLCDHALLSGYAEGRETIDAEIIRDCAGELRIPENDSSYGGIRIR